MNNNVLLVNVCKKKKTVLLEKKYQLDASVKSEPGIQCVMRK